MCTITALISALRSRSSDQRTSTLVENYFPDRRVEKITYSALNCDGYIQPLGSRFKDGFEIVLNRSLPATRMRFTLAHELCHTFFYEYVPEFKFVPHAPDAAEERLCNVGASELLMPRKSIMDDARGMDVCIQSLDNLARRYSVSKDAMLIRLRTLDLWNAELSKWRPTARGEFVCHKIIGARNVQWNWLDDSMAQVWRSGQVTRGNTSVEYISQQGLRQSRPICYEMQRRGDHILVLWGVRKKLVVEKPLFA